MIVDELVASWIDDSTKFVEDGIMTYSLEEKFYNGEGYLDDIYWVMDRIGDVLSFDTQQVAPGTGDVRFGYEDPNSGWAGTAWERWDHWKVSLNVVDDYGDWDRELVLHEMGHVLGLEHPFDDWDGDYWDTNTDYTVMAYQSGDTGNAFDYREADWLTLGGIYGFENFPVIEDPFYEEPVIVDDPEVPPVTDYEDPIEVDDGITEIVPFELTYKKETKIAKWERKDNVEKIVRKLYQWGALDDEYSFVEDLSTRVT